jgi:hypothetical protein
MNIQHACKPHDRVVAGSLSRPKCPRCATVLLVAEQSGFNGSGRIGHLWSCDDCGHAFATTVSWPPRQPA